MSRLYLGLIILCVAASLFATQMIIHKTDGTDIQVNINEIENITFSPGQTFEWCLIPSGDYTYGEDSTIQNIDYDYEIMKYEVTNTQYLAYLRNAYPSGDIWVSEDSVMGYYPGDEHWEAGDRAFYYLAPAFWQNSSRISYSDGEFTLNYPSAFTLEDYLNHPVVYVTWFGAWHFSNYNGWRLPTEHEWEKAARGMAGYDYPWGNDIDSSRANYINSDNPYDNGTTPVGFYNGETHTINGVPFITTDSPSTYGVYDMAVNVWNWTDSFWSTTGDFANRRVIRGGSWGDDTSFLVSWGRGTSSPIFSLHYFGFRCARSTD